MVINNHPRHHHHYHHHHRQHYHHHHHHHIYHVHLRESLDATSLDACTSLCHSRCLPFILIFLLLIIIILQIFFSLLQYYTFYFFSLLIKSREVCQKIQKIVKFQRLKVLIFNKVDPVCYQNMKIHEFPPLATIF